MSDIINIKIRQLGLAAYIRMRGEKLLRLEGREFVFESRMSEEEWRVEYSNSCCMRHDALVCELRNHLQRSS